jgi:glycosyltransferase involved in cell wall biosynthesis
LIRREPMKILLVHNFYGAGAPSGENIAYNAEVQLLRDNGNEVIEYTRSSDELYRKGVRGRFQGAASAVWNPRTLSAFRIILSRIIPDIVHIHNTFPMISPSVFYGKNKRSIPFVMTLHNYRLWCSAGTAMRSNKNCTECLDKKSVLPALKYGCYRASRIATAPVAAMIALHTKLDTWRRHVDAFITLTDFQRTLMIRHGLPEERLFVKPHFGLLQSAIRPWDDREEKVVFIGRMYEAKGIHILLEAWMKWGERAPRLDVIGDGPMMQELSSMIVRSSVADKVNFLGQLPQQQVLEKLSRAKMLMIPSLCFEGFPMVLHEAFAQGVPVAASRIGSLENLVRDGETGILFPVGDPDALRHNLEQAWNNTSALRQMSLNASEEYRKKYTAENNYRQLMNIYTYARQHVMSS